MTFFDELRDNNTVVWNEYIDHAFVRALGDGTLPLHRFQDYLIQDYHFLVHFARAYALAAFKGGSLRDLQDAGDGFAMILKETELHIALTESWGLDGDQVESASEKAGTIAYTRYVLDTGLAGDLLDLHVALAPCVIGYAEIGRKLTPALEEREDHPYRQWIATYAADDFQAGAERAIEVIDSLAQRYLTENRREKLNRIFSTATRMEAAFWQQALAD